MSLLHPNRVNQHLLSRHIDEIKVSVVSCAACAFDVVNQQLVTHMLAMVPGLPLHVSVKLDLSLSHSGNGM